MWKPVILLASKMYIILQILKQLQIYVYAQGWSFHKSINVECQML